MSDSLRDLAIYKWPLRLLQEQSQLKSWRTRGGDEHVSAPSTFSAGQELFASARRGVEFFTQITAPPAPIMAYSEFEERYVAQTDLIGTVDAQFVAPVACYLN